MYIFGMAYHDIHHRVNNRSADHAECTAGIQTCNGCMGRCLFKKKTGMGIIQYPKHLLQGVQCTVLRHAVFCRPHEGRTFQPLRKADLFLWTDCIHGQESQQSPDTHQPRVFGFLEGDDNTKPCGETDGLFKGIIPVNIISFPAAERFLHEVSAVAGCIDNDVFGTRRGTSFKNCFQGSKLIVGFGKGQIINKEDELERVCCELFDDRGYQIQLGFVDLNKPQTV